MIPLFYLFHFAEFAEYGFVNKGTTFITDSNLAWWLKLMNNITPAFTDYSKFIYKKSKKMQMLDDLPTSYLPPRSPK